VLTSLIAAYVLLSWLDHKKGWQCVPWLNCKVANPFGRYDKSVQHTQNPDKDQIIAQLTERVQVLEKVVTEPAYELNQKLNRL
jgi:hypothetical protein